MDAMDYIDPALIAAADAPAPRRGKTRWLRPALIAACLCLALAGTAVAAQVFSVQVDFQPDRASDPDFSVPGLGMYTVSGGVAYFPEDIFSQEVRELGRQGIPAKSFSTWDELERFVGRNLMDNPVLEGAPRGISSEFVGMRNATNVLLTASSVENGLFDIGTQDNYKLDDVLLRRRAVLYTDVAQENFRDTYGEDHEPEIYWYYDAGAQLSEEEYTTPNGLTAAIVREDGRFTEYTAHFSINGVRCTIMASYQGKDWQQDNSEHVLAVLKQVLDGFVLN